MSFGITLTTSNSVINYDAQKVLLVGDEGLIEILPNHSDILLKLYVSVVKITTIENQVLLFFVNGGLVEVKSGNMEIISPLIVLIKDKFAATEYFKIFKEKSQIMKQLTEKATNSQNFYEQQTTDEFYLFEEERLAKFEIFNEIIKGK